MKKRLPHCTASTNLKLVWSYTAGNPSTLKLESWRSRRMAPALCALATTSFWPLPAPTLIPREGIDFFPLTVDYREYTYAAGRIPGGFIKREGRPSEREILTSRQIDRPIRPLFPEGFRCETQVIAMVLSADTENDPDVAGINGASVALSVSDIPFHGPIGAVRVGQVDGNFIINPTYAERRDGNLNLMVVGTAEGIVMIESGAREVSEETVVQGIEFGHQEIKKICAAISDLARKVGKPKRVVEPVVIDEAYLQELRSKLGDRLLDAVNTERHPKNESYTLIKGLKTEIKEAIPEEDEDGRKKAGKYFDLLREQLFREQVIKQHRRPDGRKFDQVRDIWIEVGVLPRTHGSAIFTRGETQALVTTTLGTGKTCSVWKPSKAKPRSASCCITISRRSRWAKSRSCVAQAVARLATAPWPSARFPACCLRKPTGPTPCAWSPTSWSRTARRRWRRFAGLRSA